MISRHCEGPTQFGGDFCSTSLSLLLPLNILWTASDSSGSFCAQRSSSLCTVDPATSILWLYAVLSQPTLLDSTPQVPASLSAHAFAAGPTTPHLFTHHDTRLDARFSATSPPTPSARTKNKTAVFVIFYHTPKPRPRPPSPHTPSHWHPSIAIQAACVSWPVSSRLLPPSACLPR